MGPHPRSGRGVAHSQVWTGGSDLDRGYPISRFGCGEYPIPGLDREVRSGQGVPHSQVWTGGSGLDIGYPIPRSGCGGYTIPRSGQWDQVWTGGTLFPGLDVGGTPSQV